MTGSASGQSHTSGYAAASLHGVGAIPGRGESDPGGGLSLRRVSRAFSSASGRLDVLQGISVDVAPGEFVSIVGPSGSGKSTLLAIAAGLDAPDSGEVWIDGAATAGRAGLTAFMPQRDLLFPWLRVVDNAALGMVIRGVPREEARAVISDLLPDFGLQAFADAYPATLSGGMRQRVALLRTVAQECPVMLLDEPFGALDSLTRREMHGWLADVWQRHRRTVLLVTHDLREAIALSDRIYVFSARPARVLADVAVNLPRPRTAAVLASAAAAELEQRLLTWVLAEE